MKRPKNKRHAGIFVCAGALAALGCDDPLTPVEVVDKTRIIGARVEVGGDPSRAAPLPGENVDVRFLVVAPNPEPSLAFALHACVATDSVTDLPACAGPDLATATSTDPLPAPPAITFDAPLDATGDERLVVQGRFCPDGVALEDGDAPACAQGRGPLDVSLDFSMDDGAHPNSNPSLTRVTLDGVEIGADTTATLDCTLLPELAHGSAHALSIELADDSRDPLPPETAASASRESLLLSYFVSSGELDHAYSAIESTATSLTRSVTWTAPGAAADARVERFYVVVRDGRGGADFAERRVCVLP